MWFAFLPQKSTFGGGCPFAITHFMAKTFSEIGKERESPDLLDENTCALFIGYLCDKTATYFLGNKTVGTSEDFAVVFPVVCFSLGEKNAFFRRI